MKVAVPCDPDGRPIPSGGIFHEKAGIVADRTGDRLAWNGSLNETAAGWQRHRESINVCTSWEPEDDRGRLAGPDEDAPDDETMDDMPDYVVLDNAPVPKKLDTRFEVK